MAGPLASCVMIADIGRILLENDDSGSIHFSETSDNDVDYSQEENWNKTDKVV
jgi:hypothetical protein